MTEVTAFRMSYSYLTIILKDFSAYDIVKSNGQFKLTALHNSGTWIPLHNGTEEQCVAEMMKILTTPLGGL